MFRFAALLMCCALTTLCADEVKLNVANPKDHAYCDPAGGRETRVEIGRGSLSGAPVRSCSGGSEF